MVLDATTYYLSRMAIRQVSLIVNCGYARVSIHQNSYPAPAPHIGRKARQSIDIIQRAEKFKAQFTAPTYGIPEGYFSPTGKNHISQFDRDSSKILDGFSMPFRNDIGATRESYLETFSPRKWSELSPLEKSQHTLSHCTGCFETHQLYQLHFPLKPRYHPEPAITIDRAQLLNKGPKAFTTSALAELNRVYSRDTNCSFTESLLKDKSLGLEQQAVRGDKRRGSYIVR